MTASAWRTRASLPRTEEPIEKRKFTHQTLDAHDAAQELYVGVFALTQQLPRGFSELRDQARRAAHATVRNLAEGANRLSPADKRNRYIIAHGEVGECESCLDTIERLGIAPSSEVCRLRALANRVSAMLMGLAKRWS